jgi:hypothetical protein
MLRDSFLVQTDSTILNQTITIKLKLDLEKRTTVHEFDYTVLK